MEYSKQNIATMVFQKVTGRATSVDLNDIQNNGVLVFNSQYDVLLGTAMQKHTWTWTNCCKTISIDDLFESDDINYNYKLPEPEHMKVLKGIYLDEECTQKIKFSQHDKYIFISVPEETSLLYIKYISEPCESIMPDYFVSWFVYFLAAEMCLEISGDTDKFKILTLKQSDFLKIALAADNKRGGIKYVSTNRYIDVRK